MNYTKAELTKAIDVLTDLAASDVVKSSEIIKQDLEKLELSYHRKLREIQVKYSKRKAAKNG
jgi:hypothetical protein